MSTVKEAARRCCNSERAKNGRLTESIVSNGEILRLVASTAFFAMLMLAVPTALAMLKQWGWW